MFPCSVSRPVLAVAAADVLGQPVLAQEPAREAAARQVPGKVSVVPAGPTGGRLPNEHYDEFVLRFRAPDRPSDTLWFAVRQECEGGRVVDWSQVPAAGTRISDYPTPAASIRLTPR